MASKILQQRGALDFHNVRTGVGLGERLELHLSEKWKHRPFETYEKNKISSSFAKPCELALAYNDDILG